MNMTKYFLFIFALALVRPALATQPAYDFWTGSYHACGIDDTGFRCWGNNDSGQSNNMHVRNVRQVAIGDHHTCVLDDDGVLCWGTNGSGQVSVPPLKNPRYITAWRNRNCALDDNGLVCWGAGVGGDESFLNNIYLPKFTNLRAVELSFSSICVLDGDNMVCWNRHWDKPVVYKTNPGSKLVYNGGDSKGICAVSNDGAMCDGGFSVKASGLKKIARSGLQTCILDDHGLNCWTYEDNKFRTATIPPLKNPRDVAQDNLQMCALDDEGVKCWETNPRDIKPSEYKLVEVPALKSPQRLLNGFYGACAVDLTGVVCWSVRKDIFEDFSTDKLSLAWYKVEPLIENLLSNNPPNRGKYFSEMYAFYQTILNHDYFVEFQSLFLNFLAPAIESVDSEHFKTTVIPEFKALLAAANDYTARRNIVILDSELNRQLALKSLLATLNVASEFLAPEDRQNLLPVIRALGLATNDPNNKAITQALAKLESAQLTLDILKNSKKTEFVEPTLAVAVDWLRAQIKKK